MLNLIAPALLCAALSACTLTPAEETAICDVGKADMDVAPVVGVLGIPALGAILDGLGAAEETACP